MRYRAPSCLRVCLALLALAGAGPASGQDDWPPISTEEMALKECPQQPGAPAIFLYREVTTDHGQLTKFIHNRLKVLTPAGKERANVEIPFVKGTWRVEGLKARVVQPDGRASDFKGQVFEKTAVRAGRMKTLVKAFALPDVEVGSIIDYRYKLVRGAGGGGSRRSNDALEDALGVQGKPPEGGIDSDTGVIFIPVDVWNVQEDLFTRKVKFSYGPSWELERYFAQIGKQVQLRYTSQKLTGVAPSWEEGRIEQVFENVPAFEIEEFMPPESSVRMKVQLFYLENDPSATDNYWEREARNWQKGLEKFMSKPGDAAAEALRATGGTDDPDQVLRAIYGRAQEIENLSYYRTPAGGRRGERKIKENKSVADVFKNGYGLRSDITRAFAVMAKAAGFEVKVVRALMRDDKHFDEHLCGLYDQFDAELALIKVGGEEKLFDPATPFCPMGLVRWPCTGSICIAPTDAPPLFQPTPVYPPDSALTQREIALALDSEGNLTGTIVVIFRGQEALIRRVDHIGQDEAEIREAFEAEMAGLLPAGSKVSLTKLENIDNNADNVVARFEVGLIGSATRAGDKTLLPVSPLIGSRRHPFRHAARKYAIEFQYPFREFDDIVFSLPEGLKLDTAPAARKNEAESFGFSIVAAPEDGNRVHVQRDLIVRKSHFFVSQYKTVKGFFDELRAGDEEFLVLAADEK